MGPVEWTNFAVRIFSGRKYVRNLLWISGKVRDLRLILHGTAVDPRSSITKNQENKARELCGKYKGNTCITKPKFSKLFYSF